VNNCDPCHPCLRQRVGASVARGVVRSDVNYPALCLGLVRDCRWAKVHGSRWAAVAERAQRVERLPHQVRPLLDDCQRVACQWVARQDALLQHRLVSARVPAPDEAVLAGLVAIP
jgi:hypothetical protein